jgi:hypothetical protein
MKKTKNLEGLPEELKRQLSKSYGKLTMADKILKILSKTTPKDLNDILIEFYKKNNEILKRVSLSIAISKLIKNGLVKRHNDKVGIYILK